MSETQVFVETVETTYEIYRWHCPECGCKRERSTYHPGDRREDLLCRECLNLADRQRFQDHFAQVVGATVTAVVQPEEAFDWQDVKRLELVDAQGRRWLVTSDDIIYVYPDERTPGVQGGGDE